MAAKRLTKYTDEELDIELNARADVRANEMLEIMTSGHFFRHPLSRVRVQLDLGDEPSMTHEAHAESCDINNIIRQFDRTGVLPMPNKRSGVYTDVSMLNRDFGELILNARETHAAMLADQREKADEDRRAEIDRLAIEKAKELEATRSALPSTGDPSPSPTPSAGG